MPLVILGTCNHDLSHSDLSSDTKNSILNEIQSIFSDNGLIVKRLKSSLSETIWIRDLFFMLDNQAVICNLTTSDSIGKDRSSETQDIVNLFDEMNITTTFIPKHFSFEGGDFFQYLDNIIVGIGERTSIASFQELKKRFGSDYKFFKIRHSDLHLDCCFAILHDLILFKKSRTDSQDIRRLSYLFTEHTFVDVDALHAHPLCTNFVLQDFNIFTGAPDDSFERILKLSKIKYNLVNIPQIDALTCEGGRLRCLSQFVFNHDVIK